MSTKYYRVKEDTFMWEKGAVIESHGDGYRLVDPVWEAVPLGAEYITDKIIEHENNAKFFERVYPISLLSKTVYKLKEEAKEFLSKEVKE